jgi:hypothetical protein
MTIPAARILAVAGWLALTAAPMRYAALAGQGIILIQQGKEAQDPLKRALAISPWLKERNLIDKDSERKN